MEDLDALVTEAFGEIIWSKLVSEQLIGFPRVIPVTQYIYRYLVRSKHDDSHLLVNGVYNAAGFEGDYEFRDIARGLTIEQAREQY